jgi:hypothetical protein
MIWGLACTLGYTGMPIVTRTRSGNVLSVVYMDILQEAKSATINCSVCTPHASKTQFITSVFNLITKVMVYYVGATRVVASVVSE